MKSKSRLLDNVYFLMAVLLTLWGSFTAIVKILFQDIDNFQFLFYYYGFAALVMTLLVVGSGKAAALKRMTGKECFRLFLYAIPSFAYYFLYALSLRMIPATEAAILNYLFPILIMVFAVPINGEKLSPVKVASILLGFLGVIIILTHGDLRAIRISNVFGDSLALGAAACWGIFSNLLKKNRSDLFLSNYLIIVYSFVFSIAGMLIFSGFVMPRLSQAAVILWLSVANIVVAFYLWTRAMKIGPSALVASLSFITPFVTLLFIVLLLGEKMTWIQVAGLLLILSGSAVQMMSNAKKQVH
jgi:drug/metabolite transporter (DMT)-like permease